MAIISIDKIDDSKSRQYKAGRKKTGEGSTAIGSRVPPHSNQAELAVLGSVMIDRAAIAKVIEILKPEYFYSPAHQIIYDTVLNLFDKNIAVDLITVSEALHKRKILDEVGGTNYLTMINANTPSSANVEHHARIVQERYLKRALINASGNILERCYDESTDALEEIEEAERMIFSISESRYRTSYQMLKDIAHKTLEIIDNLKKRDQTGITGVPSGYKELDRLTGGFQNSDFIVLAGRPSMGKTALGLSIARNVAVEYKMPVAFFSIEMSATQLAIRLLSGESRVDQHQIRVGRINEDETKKIVNSMSRLAEAPFIIDDSAMLTIMELRAKCRRLKHEHNISMAVVDYLQLLYSPKSESREREISIISQSLKQLAKELNIPIMALAQLNRSVESRGDKRPMLSDLRESGSIEQDADVVLFINRPEYYGIKTYEDKQPTEGTGEVIIGKQRNGSVGTIRLAYVKNLARFENLALQYEERPADIPEVNDYPGF